MKRSPKLFSIFLLIALTGLSAVQAQESSLLKPEIDILSFKVGTDYNPMLDTRSPIITADSSEFPRTEGEKMVRRRSDRAEEIKSRGRSRTTIRVIDQAQWVKFEFRNTGARAIKAIEWDFAFPRYENQQLVLRYAVTSKTEIAAGKKKTIRYVLPPGANRCEIITIDEHGREGKAGKFDAVCGKGFHDPAQFPQEIVAIRRIEYSNGTVWQRP